MASCDEHSAIATRVERNEEDIQKLFDKFGEAIGLMYRLDKKMENWQGKVAGIALAASLLVGISIKAVSVLLP